MNKIVLAYCSENQIVAAKTANALIQHVEVEKVVFDAHNGMDSLRKMTENNLNRVLLFVSDNFLKSENCMNEALITLNNLGNQKRLIPIITDGVYSKDGNGHFFTVPTSFDRVSNVIQYMNFWQDRYLELRRLKPSSDEDFEFSEKVRVVRTISSEIGELLRYLRAMEFFSYDQFEDSKFIILYRVLGLNIPDDNLDSTKKIAISHTVFPDVKIDKIENGFHSNDNKTITSAPAEDPEIDLNTIPGMSLLNETSPNPGVSQNTGMHIGLPPIVEEKSADIFNSHFTLEALIDDIKKDDRYILEQSHNTTNAHSNVQKVIDEVVNENDDLADKMSDNSNNAIVDEIQNLFNDNLNETPETDINSLFEEIPSTPPQYLTPENDGNNANEFISHEEETIKNEVSRIFNEEQETEGNFEFEKSSEHAHNLITSNGVSKENPLVPYTDEIQPHEAINVAVIPKSSLIEAKEALSKDPLDNHLRYQYASELVQHHRYQDTIEQLEILIENDRTHVESYILLAYAAEQSGDYLLSLSCLEKVTLINPNYPGIFYKLGTLLSEHFKNQKRKAFHYFKEAIIHDPMNADAHYQLGKLELDQSGDFYKAIDHYKNAIQHNAQHADAAFELAKSFYEIGNKAEAAAYYAQAFENNPAFKTKINDEIFKYEEPIPEPVLDLVYDNGLTALITGATSGIGRASAEIFAKHGYRLILTGRRADRLTELKEHFEKEYKNKNQILNYDVRNLESVKKAIESIGEEFKNIDILINNAGLASGLAPIHEGDIEDWEVMIDTNIKGLLYMTRAIAPHMVNRKKGHIINVSSIAGKEIYPSGNVYIATKHAVDALTRATRVDLYKYNIRVSQVTPGAVEETEFSLVRFHGDSDKAKIYEEYQPLKASDVAESIFFIASRPEYVNIQDITLMGTQQAGANWFDKSGRKDREVKDSD